MPNAQDLARVGAVLAALARLDLHGLLVNFHEITQDSDPAHRSGRSSRWPRLSSRIKMTTTAFKQRRRIRIGRSCDSCGEPRYLGPHPDTGRVLDYCQHRRDCVSHNEVVAALRGAGIPERDIAETT